MVIYFAPLAVQPAAVLTFPARGTGLIFVFAIRGDFGSVDTALANQTRIQKRHIADSERSFAAGA
jgi:hypothetical protein